MCHELELLLLLGAVLGSFWSIAESILGNKKVMLGNRGRKTESYTFILLGPKCCRQIEAVRLYLLLPINWTAFIN
ncbi:hypothetical protein KXD40_000599 [Peronospora effusa]|nr:hypothetical protein KXD40_000599 [Peronospora effusa]